MTINNQNGSATDDEIMQNLQEDIRNHLEKFSNLDGFLDVAALPVQLYFSQQTEYSSIPEFREHLKKVLTIYKQYFFIQGYEEKKKSLSQMQAIESMYDELVYFGERNLAKERRERLEQAVSFEEQENRPQGKVFRFKRLVKDILKG